MKRSFALPAITFAFLLASCGNKPAAIENETSQPVPSSFETVDEIDEELKKRPSDPDLWYTRGILNHDNGDLTTAINDFTKAIESDTAFTSAYHDRGICKYELEDLGGALEDYNRAILLDTAFAEAYNNRAMIFDLTGNIDMAISDYSRAIALKPNIAAAYYNRGACYFIRKDKASGCADFKKAADLGDEDAKKQYIETCQ